MMTIHYPGDEEDEDDEDVEYAEYAYEEPGGFSRVRNLAAKYPSRPSLIKRWQERGWL